MTFIESYLKKLHFHDLLIDLGNKLLSLALLFILFYVGKKVLTSIVQKVLEQSLSLTKQNKARQKTLIKLLQNTLNYCLYFLLIYWILTILGLPVSSLLAGAGLAGLAIGLGAQGFLADLVNGFFILLENQYDVGETVTIGSVSGKVSSLGIRTTQIRDFDGSLHTIPNRQITLVTNKSRGSMRARIDLPILAHTNIGEMTNIIKEVNHHWQDYKAIEKAPKILGVKTTPNGQLVFRIDITTQNGQQEDIQATFFKLYQENLLAANIPLANPLAMQTTPKISQPVDNTAKISKK